MKIREQLTAGELRPKLDRFWAISATKIANIQANFDESMGSPVVTINGQYTTRGWTEWTQGFQYGAEILQFDASGDRQLLELGRHHTVEQMATHVTHFGVHDHGFNNVSTYGNLLRLMNEGRIDENPWERRFYEMALIASGSVQAKRWTPLPDGGYVYSFNGPHSLFVDTIRSMRALAIAHKLGHVMLEEKDRRVNLLQRLVQHARSTADYSVYYGQGRDAYDIRGRTTHECIFNLNDGSFRCPSSQQGFSPFTTWTRGLAWAMLGFAELLEFIAACEDHELEVLGGRQSTVEFMQAAAEATCDFYIDNSAADGIPYWDTGAPKLHLMGTDYLERPADPFNHAEPVDSSAAAIGSQGLVRLGQYLTTQGENEKGDRYLRAGLTVLETLLEQPYLSVSDLHQGLILHSVYHRPNGWDHVPPGQEVPCGESSMWGDYHAREVALLVQRLADKGTYYTFF